MSDNSNNHGSETPRQRGIRLYLSGEHSPDEVATMIGVSRATLYNWLKQEGITGRRGRATDPSSQTAEIHAITDELGELRRAIQESGALDVGDLVREVGELQQTVTVLNGSIMRLVGIVEMLAGLSPRQSDT